MAVIRHHVGARLSETAIHNGTVYLAGQIAEDTTQDIRGQTREVLGHIDRLLAEANSDKAHLLSVQIYISDLANFEGMNAGGTHGSRRATRRRVPPSRRSSRIRRCSSRSWSSLRSGAERNPTMIAFRQAVQ